MAASPCGGNPRLRRAPPLSLGSHEHAAEILPSRARNVVGRLAIGAFSGPARLQRPNPLLYRLSSRLPAPVRRSEPQEKAMSDNKSESGFQYSITNLKPVEAVHKISLTFPDGA